jgi:hypothetical protein
MNATRRACEYCYEEMPTQCYGVHLAIVHPGRSDKSLSTWVMRADIDTDVSYFDQLPPWNSYVGVDPATGEPWS